MSMRSEHVDEMGIGEFASRSRLSARALRIYDELGLLAPARVDEDSGYRFYEPGQLRQARLIASLRQLHFPLAEIKAILPLEPAQAAERVRQFWAATESKRLVVEIVRTGSEVGVEEGGCLPTRAGAGVLAGCRGSGRQ
jgi:DNA-binding transcriptional MerR regulator